VSIRTFNFLVLIFTLLGGLSLAGIYAWTAADRDRAVYQLNALELGQERLAGLAQRLDVILTAADLAVGSGETYSANWARDQAYRLGSDIDALKHSNDLLTDHVDTVLLPESLNALALAIEAGQMQSPETLNRFDTSSMKVIKAITRAQASLNGAVDQQSKRIVSVSKRATRAQIGSAAFFIVLSITLSLFGVRLVARPLEVIQQASDAENSDALSEGAFRRAPTEIRNLAQALRRYLRHLNETVAERTRELEMQAEELQEEARRRTAAEAEMALALKDAEEASAAKSNFLSITSHELRTPLNTMTAAIALLRPEELSPEQQNYCDLALQAGENLSILLRDILDFSAVDSGNIEICKQPVGLLAFAEQVVEHSSLVADSRDVTLASYIATNLPDTVMMDSNRARQVIDNLVTNALKFSQGKPVHLSFTQRPAELDRSELVIAVSDDGPGISVNEQAMIFQPFTQLDPSLGRKKGGVGLGLALCKDLAKAMGGDCLLYSRPGEGSTFEFILPVEETLTKAVEQPVVEQQSPEDQAAHALLVEDSEVNQMLAQKLLEGRGYTVSVASDGYEACEQCAQGNFDVILMDLQMPGIDGLEATRRIKGTEGPNQFTPVIALTANVGSEFHDNAEAAGMVGFVEKPINAEKMAAEITRVLLSYGANKTASG
jgi:signal transduction histidine kinase/ActR/RegA family two-component response regulator